MEKKSGWRFLRPISVFAFVVALVGVIAPFVNAARFSHSIQAAIETSLGRKVTFQRVYFTLFSGPGFSLEGVTISEDPRYGIEPFAYVPTLEARLRLDKLVFGEIRFTSLRLVDPSLNLVRESNGSWNVQQLVQRLTAPRRAPLHFFPSFEVSDGRVNFKLGTRKTTLYISESDLTIYPEYSGKIYIRFSGSPARTDRAGMGFGHIRGDVNWYSSSSTTLPNRLEAQLFLDPSNLSELTTLMEGHDIGVHGTISTRLEIKGPIRGLKVRGEMRLEQVHRWDLLPSSGEDWSVHYGGDLDLPAHRLDLKTTPAENGQATPVTLHVRARDFLAHGGSSVMTELKGAPLSAMLPLASRLGVVLPNNADLHGLLSGAIGYSNERGLSGGLIISDARAVLPGAPTLHAPVVNVTIAGDRVHFSPSALETGEQGTLKMSGNYSWSDQRADASLSVADFPINELKPLANSWFGGLAALSAMTSGTVSGQFAYSHNAIDAPVTDEPGEASWAGQFDLTGTAIHVPGISAPLRESRAHVIFNRNIFQIEHLVASLGERDLRASYRYDLRGKRAERVRIEFPEADLAELETTFASSDRSDSLWARLRFLRRSLPSWLSNRNLEGDLAVDQLMAGGQPLGALRSHFVWEGAKLRFGEVGLTLPQGKVSGRGTVDLASFSPHWQFAAEATNYPWGGGSLNAVGQFASTGAGKDLLRNLQAEGSFEGAGLTVSADVFDNISGLFRFTFAEGWPDIRLSDIEAMQAGDEWRGDGLTQSDGKLLVNLVHEGRQLHLVSSLTGERLAEPVSSLPETGLFEAGLHF
ncbi:MAG TPA: AsmA family protein [Bryobacteraceae bacterium]|nr:AsmA family protein [Bryobacteraceae bacterium]